MKTKPEDISFIINLWSINSTLSKRIDACLGAVHGIGFTEYMVLFHINNAHNKTMRRIDLANAISLTASGITRILSPMEKIGLVEKEVNERDARVSLVKLSAAGESVFENTSVSMQENAERTLEGIKKSDLTKTLEIFKTIGKNTFI